MTKTEGISALMESNNSSAAIAQSLIEEIKQGKIELGASLPTERELCERFSTSRPTVREALIQMQAAGYAETGGGKRPRASKPSLAGIINSAAENMRGLLVEGESGAQMEQVRQFLECSVIRTVARSASNVQIARMNTCLQANFEAIGTVDFPRTDIEFHRSIIAAVGNDFIMALYDNFAGKIMANRPPVARQDNYDRTVYQEHCAMYKAILERDSVEAMNVMESHLERSYRARLMPPVEVKNT